MDYLPDLYVWFLQVNLTFLEIRKIVRHFSCLKDSCVFSVDLFLRSNVLSHERMDELINKFEKYKLYIDKIYKNNKDNNNVLTKLNLEKILNKELLESAFLAFQYLGNRNVLKRPVVAIIGSRRPTHYGREQACYFAKALAQKGCTVLSGGAIGVDSIATTSALQVGGNSCVILGSGIHSWYPASNKSLFQELLDCQRGLILSEFDSTLGPQKWTFPRRNYSIARLSDYVLIVEASCHSGSLITAEAALEYGVDVGAIPGVVDSHNSQGANALIQNGAFCVTKPQDILDCVAHLL